MVVRIGAPNTEIGFLQVVQVGVVRHSAINITSHQGTVLIFDEWNLPTWNIPWVDDIEGHAISPLSKRLRIIDEKRTWLIGVVHSEPILPALPSN